MSEYTSQLTILRHFPKVFSMIHMPPKPIATPPVCHSEQPKQKPPPVDSDDVTETPTETLVITTTNSTDHQGTIPPGSVHPGTNNITSIHDKDVGLVLNGSRGSEVLMLIARQLHHHLVGCVLLSIPSPDMTYLLETCSVQPMKMRSAPISWILV